MAKTAGFSVAICDDWYIRRQIFCNFNRLLVNIVPGKAMCAFDMSFFIIVIWAGINKNDSLSQKQFFRFSQRYPKLCISGCINRVLYNTVTKQRKRVVYKLIDGKPEKNGHDKNSAALPDCL